MNEHLQIPKDKLKSLAKTSIFFLAVGIGWILFGDNIMGWLGTHNGALTNTLEQGSVKANHHGWGVIPRRAAASALQARAANQGHRYANTPTSRKRRKTGS